LFMPAIVPQPLRKIDPKKSLKTWDRMPESTYHR
jgi:hypothetical protein